MPGDLSVALEKHFDGDSAFRLAVEFQAGAGFTILFGASGSGKTTILDCIAGLTRPERGRVVVGGRSLDDTAAGVSLAVPQRRVGYVFQRLALFPHLSVEENVGYGLRDLARAERAGRVSAVLESFRIAALRARRPGEISGGEQQRVALARALVTDPCVLLLDEPLSGLDVPTRGRIVDDLRAWNQAHAVPILYVTHSRDEVFALGERVLVLERGKLVADGTPHAVLTAPRLETVAQLVGFENVFSAQVESLHEDRGTMTCRLAASDVVLETPLVRAEVGEALRIGIRAGDILLATEVPRGLSARNVIAGRMLTLERRDAIMVARVGCGVEMEAHLTLAARDALQLQPGREVWLVLKTHSCHLLAG
jgi:molybdate transport system ATP-binding protein